MGGLAMGSFRDSIVRHGQELGNITNKTAIQAFYVAAEVQRNQEFISFNRPILRLTPGTEPDAASAG